MKKILFVVVCIALIGGWFYLRSTKNNLFETTLNNDSQINKTQNDESYIFVPYWTFSSSINSDFRSTLLYFGITIDHDGIDYDDEGYRKIDEFVNSTQESKYLVLRIFKENSGDKILDDLSFQRKIAKDAAQIAKDHKFKGVVVDYETSAFGFTSTEKKITTLLNTLGEEIKNENLEYFVTVFGDTYYRGRPYNIPEISKIADKVIIMAYDFHKARLNPGPNFPLSGKSSYGYDFKTMVEDFRKDVPFEKIIITLGYFGYDWKTREGVNQGMAEPLSLNQINSRFVDKCLEIDCRVERNKDLETVIKYRDSDGFDHEVWVESKDSGQRKIEYLDSRGIRQIAFWAYSYY